MDIEVKVLRAMMMALPDPVFIITESGKYIEIVGGLDELFYHDGSFLKGKTIYDVLPRKKADWFLEQIHMALQQDRLRTVNYSLAGNEVKGLDTEAGPEGDIRFEGRIQPLPLTFEGERAVIWTARNITTQYEYEVKLKELSETDVMTGVLNRRKFLEVLDERFHEFKRYEYPTSLIIFDIDNFKRVNDSFGHHMGDEVLCQITNHCASQLRLVDKLCRIGGEEFAIVLPQTNAKSAYQIAERLRYASEQLDIVSGAHMVRVTISLGISEFINTDTVIDDVMRRADTALYEAKEKGRNQLVCRYHNAESLRCTCKKVRK